MSFSVTRKWLSTLAIVCLSSIAANQAVGQSISVDLDNVSISTFTETFDLDDANWASGAFAQLTYANGYVSNSILASSEDTTMFRGHSSFVSSNGSFAGDWIADGVESISFDVRHDWPGPVNFFSRIAPPTNFPGQIGVSFVPVFPNRWTTVTLDLSPTSVSLFDEGQPYAATFANVGNVQVGISALVPEPSGTRLAVLAMVSLCALRRRRI